MPSHRLTGQEGISQGYSGVPDSPPDRLSRPGHRSVSPVNWSSLRSRCSGTGNLRNVRKKSHLIVVRSLVPQSRPKAGRGIRSPEHFQQAGRKEVELKGGGTSRPRPGGGVLGPLQDLMSLKIPRRNVALSCRLSYHGATWESFSLPSVSAVAAGGHARISGGILTWSQGPSSKAPACCCLLTVSA